MDYRAIAQGFNAAAKEYNKYACLQRSVANKLAQQISQLNLPEYPRILEVGCGTGFLSAALARKIGAAHWTLSDMAEQMLTTAKTHLNLPGSTHYHLMNGEFPDDLGEFDLICSSLAVQWFNDLDAGLARLAKLLAPRGVMAIATLANDSFIEWRKAHCDNDLQAATRAYPAPDDIAKSLPLARTVADARYIQQHIDGKDFLHTLKAIGANTTDSRSKALSVTDLRRVLRAFNQDGASITYHIAYILWQRPAINRGVFVTGTDTGVGKTLVAAVLTQAWQADYWKPLQTGVATEPDDTHTVKALTGMSKEHFSPPHMILHSAQSPWAAAVDEGKNIKLEKIHLPKTRNTLVVEGAGGILVPIHDSSLMIDLMAQFKLPIILVARSTLGTLNHTLMSLEILRQRNLAVLGVILCGELSPINRLGIEQFGKVKVLAQIPPLNEINEESVKRLAADFPSYDDLMLEHQTM